jgi:hypothetical protein
MNTIKSLRLSVAAAVLTSASLADAAPTYRVTEIPIPAPYDQMVVEAINDSGDVAGGVFDGDVFPGNTFFRMSEGMLQIIPAPVGATSRPRVIRINNAKQIIAQLERDAYFWSEATSWVRIELPDGVSAGGVYAFGLNDRGDVVGRLDFASVGRSTTAFSWTQQGGVRIYKPGENAEFLAINNRRQVAGELTYDASDHQPPRTPGRSAQLFRNGHDPIPVGDMRIRNRRDLDKADKRGVNVDSNAYDINVAGAMAIEAINFDNEFYPCIWTRQDGLACAEIPARPFGLNDRGELLFNDNGSPYVFKAGQTSLRVVDALEPGSPVVISSGAQSLNNLGVIAANVVYPDGSSRSVLYTPIE